MLGRALNRTRAIPRFFGRSESIALKEITSRYSTSLKSRIELCGPISVADYMKEVLTNPKDGYYMKSDVFGAAGDFITSPEISQLFGEMIAVWLVNEWQKIGSPKPFQLVELGPGRGTMMKDILRVLSKLKIGQGSVEIHLVEVSKQLSMIQAENLCVEHELTSSNDAFPLRGLTGEGVPVFWHPSFTLLPKQFSVIVAHEFFDAMPIHKFQKTSKGWREVLVDIDPQNPGNLRFVLSEVPTPASILLVKKTEKREQVEISPLSGVIMGQIAQHLEAYGGFALVADYGHFGDKGDTFRAFSKHKLQDPLIEPGSADLTADVDFSFLKDAVADKLITFGPINQCDFLRALHIDIRLKKLLETPANKESEDLLSGYKMIMDEKGMGKAFKFMSFFPAVLKQFLEVRPPAGF